LRGHLCDSKQAVAGMLEISLGCFCQKLAKWDDIKTVNFPVRPHRNVRCSLYIYTHCHDLVFKKTASPSATIDCLPWSLGSRQRQELAVYDYIQSYSLSRPLLFAIKLNAVSEDNIIAVTHIQETCTRNFHRIERSCIRCKFLAQVSCTSFLSVCHPL